MAASDLATLADVKTWLAGSSGIGSSDDALISRLITDVSGAITAYLGRPSLTPRLFMERLDGNDKTRLFLRHYPVLQVITLLIDTAIVPAAAPVGMPSAKGYLLESWDGLPPGRPQALDVFRTYYRKGRQNVVVDYSAGYAVENEPANVPTSPAPYSVAAAAPLGPWASDAGVTYVNGAALVAVASNPAAGEYAVANGAYTFAAADAGAAVLISYGFIPAAINNACIEWVAERYRYRTRVGQSAQTVQGQQTASYSLKDIPEFVRASLDPYRSVVGGVMFQIDLRDDYSASLAGMPDRLRQALSSKANVLAVALEAKIQQKLSGGVLNTRSGALASSIIATVDESSADVSVRIGTSGDVKYAAIQEFGGTIPPHEIVPDKAKALAFVVGGKQVFAARVNLPAVTMPERSYLRSSLAEMAGEIREGFSEAAIEAMQRNEI